MAEVDHVVEQSSLRSSSLQLNEEHEVFVESMIRHKAALAEGNIFVKIPRTFPKDLEQLLRVFRSLDVGMVSTTISVLFLVHLLVEQRRGDSVEGPTSRY